MIYNESDKNGHWKTRKLSDLGTFSRGVSRHRPRNDARLFENGCYPLIQTGDVKSSNLYITTHNQEYGEFGLAQSKLWDAGTLCITIAANIAETGILAYPMCFPDSVVGFRADPEEATEEFMYYVFEYIKQSIQNAASGSIQDNINIEVLTGLEFKIPPATLRNQITEVLVGLDRAILSNEEIDKSLQSMLSTLYNYWFVQFDFPDENGNPYRASGGAMVWNDRLKREIPEGWTVASIIDNSLTEVIKPGVRPFSTKRYLATADVVGTDIKDGTFIEYETRETRANMEPTQNSVWFAKMKSSIKHLFLTESMLPLIKESILSTGFLGLQCTDTSFEYIASFIANPLFEMKKDQLAHGATQEAVNNDDLKLVPLLIPDEKTLHLFHNATKDAYATLGKNIMENRTLSSLRDWLLPMFMNGQATMNA